MLELKVSASGRAEFGDRTQKELAQREPKVVEADIVVKLNGVDQLSDDALDRMYRLLRREVERIAQVAAVDARDEVINKMEVERIRQAPKDRPQIIVGVGSKDDKMIQVTRGTWEVGKEKKKMSAPTEPPKQGGR